MKKFLCCVMCLIILCILIFIIIFFRNYIILKKIYELGNNFNPGENYSIRERTTTSIGTSAINYYFMDNKYIYIEELDNGYKSLVFHNLNTDEYNEFIFDENGEAILVNNPQNNNKSNIIDSIIYCKSYNFSSLLKQHIFKIIEEDEEHYIIYINNQKEYINKSNGLLTKIKSEQNNIDMEILFEKDSVDESMIDITQYSTKK